MVDQRAVPSDIADFDLTICGIDELHHHSTAPITHVLSILDPEAPVPQAFEGYAALRQHWVLRFHDVSAPIGDARVPEQADVEQVLAFAAELQVGAPNAHLLVHCHAGVSRSTAAAAILLAQRNPGKEAEAFQYVARIRPGAWPNRRMVEIADRLMHCDGRLIEGLRAMPRVGAP
ncbi:tyrosine phosphatase family protein [Rhodovibrio salinarum]|nr:dual specificity protein phosphatase family protein [Rhodovibrio salinarum]